MGRVTLTASVIALTLGTAGASALAGQSTPSDVLYVQAGTLLDRPGKPPRGKSTIIVRNGKIVEVRDGFVAPPAGATLIDLHDRYVLPGLIDLHVHLAFEGDPIRDRTERLNRDDGDILIIAENDARKDLQAGFTTVRDLDGPPRVIRALRDGIDRAVIPGPTIVNAGHMISVSGGHGDQGNGLAEEFADAVHSHEGNTCNGADDCRRAVREQIALGATVIKIAATGGVLSNVAGGLGQQMTDEEIAAVVQTAHQFGRRVAAHAHAKDGIRAAVAAGVDTIEHGSFVDDETIAAMKAKGIWLVPTMLAPVTAVAQARAGQMPPPVLAKAEEAGAAATRNQARAIRAGVKIAFGTDTGVSRHGDNAREFALLVGNGLTPAQAVATATVNAAEALGRSAEIGSVEPGKWADLIAVADDPLTDVRTLERVQFVMRHGVIHRQNGRPAAFPAE